MLPGADAGTPPCSTIPRVCMGERLFVLPVPQHSGAVLPRVGWAVRSDACK